jgi:hypothetical protein
MYFLFSGEGITDLGVGKSAAAVSTGDEFVVGPLTILADQIVESGQGFSILEADCCGYVSEAQLCERAVELKAAKKGLALPGKKRAKETRYFFNNARAFARIAAAVETERKDSVVAILFRDSDGTASAGRGEWSDKRQSMLDGFEQEGFLRGVPMMPKPKSEAWLICALKKKPCQGCDKLEERSGNDRSPRSLKGELARLVGEPIAPELLCDRVRRRVVDFDKIRMPSFVAFRQRLDEVV